MNLIHLSAVQLRRAAEITEQMEKLSIQLHKELGSEAPRPTGAHDYAPRKTGAHRWSAAQRRKFKATMRERGYSKK